MSKRPLIGTAGWSLPRAVADQFPPGDSQLARYAQRLSAAEINTSFYRSHQRKTYARWAATVSDTFRFSVKLPKTITHERRLVGVDDLRDCFLEEISGLGDRLGPILIQLPPSLAFDPEVIGVFFTDLRASFHGQLACEPRHASWFTSAVDQLLADVQVARVAADPSLHPRAGAPGGWTGLTYRRLHGAPKVYYSDYPAAALEQMAEDLCSSSVSSADWCVFDNTTLGHATANALHLQGLIVQRRERS